ncbi:MAG TPA: arylsulfatase [Sphaerochaeta sp.]|nr:arylsulfatase [Sphaerochaeta sp.]
MQHQAKPNIIYILADDMGYGDVSANNESCPFTTPSLDSLAKHGLRFTDAHASSAVCTPSRYSIMTGRYNWRSPLKEGVLGGYSSPLIPEERSTVAHMLKASGYRTEAIGKWHLGMEFPKLPGFVEQPDFAYSEGVDFKGTIRNSPISAGFDYYYGISGSLDTPPYVYIENDRFTAVPDRLTKGTGKAFWRQGLTAPDFVHEEVLDHLTDKVLQSIGKKGDQPFFIYFALPAPHTPILPHASFRGKSNTNAYGDFVLHCDDVVRRVEEQLKAEGLLENTLIVFTSDNGCSPVADFAELAEKGHNPSYHFRGMKSDIFEGGHRVPLLVQWPDALPQNMVCDRLVCLSDLFATLADYLGYEMGPSEAEDSVSNRVLWEDPSAEEVRTSLVHQSIDGSLSIRSGKWKLEMCPGSGGWSDPQPGSSKEASLPRLQLYDLASDIGERHNVAIDHPFIVANLQSALKRIVLDGRSTPGPVQKNEGQAIWKTVSWLDEA